MDTEDKTPEQLIEELNEIQDSGDLERLGGVWMPRDGDWLQEWARLIEDGEDPNRFVFQYQMFCRATVEVDWLAGTRRDLLRKLLGLMAKMVVETEEGVSMSIDVRADTGNEHSNTSVTARPDKGQFDPPRVALSVYTDPGHPDQTEAVQQLANWATHIHGTPVCHAVATDRNELLESMEENTEPE